MLIVCMYGIVYYDYRTGRIADAGYDFSGYQNNVTINNATFDHEDNLYISTSEHGVLMIRKGSNRVEQLENSNSSFNLATAFVNDIIEDKDNNLWIGCYKKGLYLINQRQQAFNSWSFSAQNYIIGSSVSSIAQGEMVKHGVQYRTVVCSVLMLQARLSPIPSHLPVLASSIKTDVAITGSAMVAHSTATTLIQVHTSRNSPLPAPASTV